MQISFDKEPVKGTQLEKLLPALLSVKKGGRGWAAAVHFDGVRIGADVGIKCRSYYTHSQPGCDSNGKGEERDGGVGWFTDMQIGSCSGNIITLPSTPGDGPRKTRRQLRVFFIFEAIKLRQIQLGGPD